MSGNNITKIIFIEDEDVIVEIYRIIMEKIHDEIDCTESIFCTDGQEAVKAISENPGCIVFCDLCLTGISGESILKKIDSDLIKKFFIVTGYTSSAIINNKVEVIQKPFSIDQIIKIIKSYY